MSVSYLGYRVKYDYHTHTVYSHGKGTIEDNVRTAFAKGLSGVGISDHGPGHLLYGLNAGKIRSMKNDIARLKGIYPDMEILLSVEANIHSAGNCLDLNGIRPGDFDFLIAGYHYGVWGGYGLANLISSNTPFGTAAGRKQITKNTNMVIKAIYENQIMILTHPGAKGFFDIYEIAKACAERGTYLEINDRHEYLSAEGIRQAAGTDVKFVICSDAHAPGQVGSCGRGIKRAIDAGLDMERVVNIEKFDGGEL